jgi:acetyl esterase
VSLARRARVVIKITDALQRAGLMPTVAKAANMPLEKRIGGRPPTALTGKLPAGVAIEERTITGRTGNEIALRIYRPQGGGVRPGLVYFHGGGWVMGSVLACEHICMRIAADAGVTVASVEYRLAPDDPYPAGLHDCVDATRWVYDKAGELGIDPSRFGVGGDSAGGNLAAAVVLADPPPLTAAVLIYPALDFTYSTPSAREYPGPGATAADLAMAGPLYLADLDPADPLCSPLLAEDLSAFPPTLVITAEYDPLRDEGRVFAERLQEAGVPVRFTNYVEYLHGFFSVPRMYPGVEQAWSELTGWVRDALVARK